MPMLCGKTQAEWSHILTGWEKREIIIYFQMITVQSASHKQCGDIGVASWTIKYLNEHDFFGDEKLKFIKH